MKRTVYIFHCSTHSSLYGFTFDATGANLPKEECGGHWVLDTTIEISDTDPRLISGLLPRDILAKLDADGYFIIEIKITFRERAV